MMKYLDEKTLIPFGLAISVIGGGAAWLTTIYNQGIANASQIRSMGDRQDRYLEEIQKIREELAGIRVELIEIKRKR